MLIKTHESVFSLAFFVSYPFILFCIFVQKKLLNYSSTAFCLFIFLPAYFKNNLTITSNRLSESSQFGIHILTRAKSII